MALNRHRDQDGTEERKRNDTLVRTLRNEYGLGDQVKSGHT